jgi:hypothetical protein
MPNVHDYHTFVVSQAVERLAEAKITHNIKSSEVIPTHDINRLVFGLLFAESLDQ